MSLHDTAIKVLNGLIQSCKNGEDGYRYAAGIAHDADLKQLLTGFGAQRGMFVTELQAKVKQLGGRPAQSGTYAAALHRLWIRARGVLGKPADAGIVAECVRGDEAAAKAYDTAATTKLSEDVLSIIRQQHQQIREALGRLATSRAADKPAVAAV